MRGGRKEGWKEGRGGDGGGKKEGRKVEWSGMAQLIDDV